MWGTITKKYVNMIDLSESAKNLAPFIPFVKPLLERILKPKLESLDSWLKKRAIDNKVIDFHIYETAFQDYLCKTLEKCSIISTLIFPNQQINIEDLYQPLTLIGSDLNQQEKIKINSYPEQLFDKYRRVLIVDSAGMGKSTLSRFICVQAIKENKGIPVFIELRRLNSKNTIIQEFLSQLNTIDNTFDKDFILRLLKLGEFIIFLDGFDEITNEEQQAVTQDIRDFVFNCTNNLFLLTSRPEGAITTFGDFKMTNIKGLRNPEAFQLFEKYDKISKKDISKRLIEDISNTSIQINEFLVNPFLVSLIYKTYSFKRDIPSRKSTFYNEVYTALYQDHDLSKDSYKRDKFSKLDIQDFRLVLRELAILTAKKGEVEYDRTIAFQYIQDCKLKLPFLNFKESNFIEDLLTTVPVFTTEGNKIKWAHKSLQDYFAAEYITFHPKKDQLINHLIDKGVRKYQNIIDLVIELDPNLMRHFVLPKILSDLITHFQNSYNIENISGYDLAIRKMITFDTDFWINKVLLTKERGKDPPFDEIDEFDRVLEILKNKYNSSYTSITNHSDKYMVSYKTSDRALFIQLLGIKGILGKSILKPKVSKYPPLTTLDVNPVLVVDTQLSSKYNSPKYFSQYNELLTDTFRTRMDQNRLTFIPDIEFCKRLLASIEKEIKSNKDSFLEDF